MRIDYCEEGEPIDRLNSLITIFQDLQNEVALLSDELDSNTLDDVEGAIDTVIELLEDAALENQGEVEWTWLNSFPDLRIIEILTPGKKQHHQMVSGTSTGDDLIRKV